MARFSRSSLARLLTSTTPSSPSSSTFHLRHFLESVEPQRNIWISVSDKETIISLERPRDSRKFQTEKTSNRRETEKTSNRSEFWRKSREELTEEIIDIHHQKFMEHTMGTINERQADINSLRWKYNMCLWGAKPIYYSYKTMVRYRLPRLVYINKVDQNGENPWEVLNQARSKLKHHIVAVQVPIGLEDDFKGLVDLVQLKAYYFHGLNLNGGKGVVEEVPADMKELVSEKRRELMETVSMVDDKFAEVFRSDKPISAIDLENAVRRVTIARKFIPVFIGNVFQYNKGLQLLLDGVINYLPCPIETSNYALNQSKYGEKHTLVALSITMKKEYGPNQITYLRIYEGVIQKGDFLTNTNTDKTFKISDFMAEAFVFLQMQVPHLFRKCNDVFKVIQEANAGEIVAVFHAPDTFTDELVSYTMTSIDDVSESISKDFGVHGKGEVHSPLVRVYGGDGQLLMITK